MMVKSTLSREKLRKLLSDGDIVYFGNCADYKKFLDRYPAIKVIRTDNDLLSQANNKMAYYCEDREGNKDLRKVDSEKTFIIIGTSQIKNDVESILIASGLIPLDNYIYEEWFDGLYEYAVNNKKIITSLGWCDVSCMGKYINQIRAIHDEYTCIQCYEFNFSNTEQEYNEHYLTNTKKLISISDIVLCSTILAGIRLKIYNEILQCADSKCRIIHIPIIDQFRGYYPQFATDRGKHKLHYTDMEKSMFYRRDGFIVSCCKKGMTLNETKELACSNHAFDNGSINDCMKFFVKLFEILDSISEIKMFEPFLSNYKNYQLFLNPGHISTIWAKEYIYAIASYISGSKIDHSEVEEIEIPTASVNVFSEAPVYPQVSDTLGLKFSDLDRKYILRYEGKDVKAVSFDEYIEILYDFYKFFGKFTNDVLYI